MSATPLSRNASDRDDPELSPYTSTDGRLPKLFSLRFSTRAISLAVGAIMLMQLTFYSTDVLGLPGTLVGGLFLAVRIIDAVTDLLISVVIDKTKTRWGKARPYELLIIPFWIGIVALFSTPDMGVVAQSIYLFITFFLVTSVFQTALYAAESIFLRRALRGEEKYAKVLSRQGMLMVVVAGGVSVLLPQMIAQWGQEPGGWTRIAVVTAIPMMVVGILRFFLVRELPSDPELDVETGPSARQILRIALTNKFAWVAAGLMLLATVASTLPSTVGTYFFLYIHGDVGLASFAAIGSLVVPFSLAIFPFFVRRFGGMWFVRMAAMLSILGFGTVFAFADNIVAVIIGGLLGAMSSVMTILSGFFLIQIIVYGEWKTGVRVEAGYNMMIGFAGKVGQGLVPALVGVTLSVVSYDGALDVQSADANFAIVSLFSLVPMIISCGVLALSFLWTLDGKVQKIQRATNEAVGGGDDVPVR